MDFNRRGQARPTTTTVAQAQDASTKPAVATPTSSFGLVSFKQGKLYRWSFVALLISGTVLFVAMIFFIVFGTPINREARYVQSKQYQAVFVNVNGTNGGQVYFGHVTSLTSQYIRLSDVFYIQNQSTDGQAANAGSYNLVKLGCELHGPMDEMLINRSQVFFWENLKSDSQVALKAAEFHKQNPTGQKCAANSGTTQQSNTNTQTPATGTNGTGTATSPTPATTPTPTTSTGTGTPTKKP